MPDINPAIELPTRTELRSWSRLAEEYVIGQPIAVAPTEQMRAVAELARAVPSLLKMIELQRAAEEYGMERHVATLPVPVDGTPQ